MERAWTFSLCFCVVCILISRSSLAIATVATDGSVVLEIQQGKLRGFEETSRNGQSYFAFLGIPFVDKPERFEAPSLAPPTPWTDVRNATAHGPMCIQYNVVTNQIKGEEDCLFLNVYTRKLNGSLPVMVYIHGGGFQWGTAHIQGPNFIMDEQIVLITFNYRLGAFGFLSTGDAVIQGNMGMKDQVAALSWVKNNIERFGGNPELITIFGESAGGAAVSLQMLSPMSKGLFQHAISQSGAALNPWACLKNPKYHMHELARNVDCPSEDSSRLRECLLGKSAEELVAHSYAKWHLDPTVPFGPVVETLRLGQADTDVFLPQSPYELLTTGKFSKIPWVVGITKDEGVYFHSSSILKEKNLQDDVNSRWATVAPITLTFYDDPHTSREELESIASEIKTFYFNDSKVDEMTRQQLTDMYSDRYFVHGVRTTAMAMAQHDVPVYPYIFEFAGSFSFVQQRGFEKPMGVTHKDDLQYLFNVLGPDPKTGREKDFSENFIKLWVSFAINGVLTPSTSWGSASQWDHITPDAALGQKPLDWFVIDEVTTVVQEPFTKRMEFWDHLLLRHPVLSYPKGTPSLSSGSLKSNHGPFENRLEHEEFLTAAQSQPLWK